MDATMTRDYIDTVKNSPCFKLAITLLVLLYAAPRRTTAAEALSTFDTGYDGWTAISLQPSGGSGWSWQPEGGHGGGFVQFRDNLSAPLFNFVTSPASFHGDWSALDGAGELRYDFRLTGDASGIRRDYVLVRGRASGVMAFEQGRTGANGDGWETISLPLTKGEWTIVSGSWEGIMSDVGSIEIYPLYNGRDYGRVLAIDNIMLVPEPRTWALLGAGLAMLLWLRQKEDHAA
jgi:hypothetical protein